MSAREDLEKWAARHVSGVEALNFDHLLSAALTETRREAAHELAEKQRDHAQEEWSSSDARMLLRWRVARYMADLIDPEVSDG